MRRLIATAGALYLAAGAIVKLREHSERLDRIAGAVCALIDDVERLDEQAARQAQNWPPAAPS